MDPTLPPSQPVQQQGPAPRKSRSPVAIVLGLSAIFFAIFLIISGIYFASHNGKTQSGESSGTGFFASSGSVGVIELKGVISDSKKIIKKLKRFENDEDIKAVVLRVNSPGGAVAPSQEIYEVVKNYKKPIIASMGSVAASGAYYVSCGTKKIIADPGTITGSIGVIMEFLNLQKLYEWAKVERYSIKTGNFKDIGAEYRPMTPQEKDLLQGMVNNVLLQFKQAVSTGRGLSMARVTAIADGRIFSGDQAKQEKLVDELGSLDDAIQEAAKMGGIKGKPTVVYPSHPKPHLLDLILNSGQSDSDDDSETSSRGFVSRLSDLFGFLTGQGAMPSEGVLGVMPPGIYWLWTGH